MRNGSLEWSLETVGKMLFYALTIIILYSLVVNGFFFKWSGKDHMAEANLDFLVSRIELAQKTGQPDSSRQPQ